MDTGQDKQQPQQNRQVAQPADGSLKMHGDQLEKPLHEMLEDDNHRVDAEKDETDKDSPDRRQ